MTKMTRLTSKQVMIALLFLLPLSGLWWSGRPLALSFVLYANLYALALYDWHSFRLPNLLTGTLFIIGLAQAYFFSAEFMAHVYGATGGVIFFLLLDYSYLKLRGRAGMGMGDTKFLGAAGAWVAWYGLPPVLLVASLTGLGAIVLKSLVFGPVDRTESFPFGPYLCFGLWLSWLYF